MKQLLALLPFFSCASAELVDVTLTLTPVVTIEPTENVLAIGVQTPAGNASDTSEVSGTISTRLDIDPTSGEISTLEFLSGDLEGTGVSLEGGDFFASFELTTTALGGTLDTPAPPAPVDSGGQSPASLHEFSINEGTLSGSFTTLLTGTTPITQDFSSEPVSGTGSEGEFVTVTATLNAAESTSTLAVYDIELAYPISISQEIDLGITVTVSADGLVRATGQTSFPIASSNPYLSWTETNGIPEAPFADSDFSDQLPNGLFWALGYSAGDTAASLTPNGDGTFALPLPAGGTVADVAVQFSFDLSNPNGWTTISTISAGTSGEQGPFGGGAGPAFLRLQVEDPAQVE